MASLPVYIPTELESEDLKPCNKCPLGRNGGSCSKQEPIYYHRSGSKKTPGDVDLLILTDPPSAADVKAGKYFSDDAAQEVLAVAKEAGAENFIVAPAVRCFPTGQIDHYALKKIYKNKGGSGYVPRKKPLEIAKEALEHCQTYTDRLLASSKAKVTVAMGPLAAKAVRIDGRVSELRTQSFHPRGLSKLSGTLEGTIVTYDRAMGQVNPWAMRSIYKDIRKYTALRKTGYASPRGDERSIEVTTFNTVAEVKGFVDFCLTADFAPGTMLSLDFETTGLERVKETTKLLNAGFAFSNDENKAFVVPLEHPEMPWTQDELAEVHGHLKRLFESVGAKFYAWLSHHAPFETEMIHLHYGIWWGEAGNTPIIDTENIAFTYHEVRNDEVGKGSFSLEGLSNDMFGWTWYDKVKAKSRRKSLEQEPIDYVNTYVGYDAVVAVRLLNELLDRMEEEGSLQDLMKLNKKLYSDAIPYVCDLRATGQVIDVDLLMMLRKPDSSIQARLVEIEKEIRESPEAAKALAIINDTGGSAFGKPIFSTSSKNDQLSLSSPEHMTVLFWEVMELEGADESLDKGFKKEHEDVHLVSIWDEWVGLSKLDSSYLKPIANFLQSLECRDGRVRPFFRLINTKTGRLASEKPNSQQWPQSNTDDKKQIKSLVRAKPGCVLVQLDFSQAEVRWLGIMSHDVALANKYRIAEELKVAFRKDPTNKEIERRMVVDGDLHMSTALDMNDYPRDLPFTDPDKAKAARQDAKKICFGLIYGKSVASLARDLGISLEECQAKVDAWLAQFPQARDWLVRQEELLAEQGYVVSPFGRWRRLPEVWSSDKSIVSRANRQCRNTPIQSAASDCCIYAATRVRKSLQRATNPLLRSVKLVNTVHDSLVAEVPADKETIRAYCELALSIYTDPMLLMEDWGIPITVPLAVDFEIGLNCGNMLPYVFDDASLTMGLHDAEVLRSQPTGTLFKHLYGKGLLMQPEKKKK